MSNKSISKSFFKRGIKYIFRETHNLILIYQVVAASGMMETKGNTKSKESKKHEPVTNEANPVRAPASTPVLDSM